jgi:hypothetical protein
MTASQMARLIIDSDGAKIKEDKFLEMFERTDFPESTYWREVADLLEQENYHTEAAFIRKRTRSKGTP